MSVAICISLVHGASTKMSKAYHVGDSVQSRDPLDLGIGDTSSTEDSWSEDGHTGDTNPLLHDLKPDDELNTTTGVKLA